ncbi:MAG: hypothetical protein OdinLCB4_000990 [Candidatus Odinarchaeum yellowstonii]|uniref:Uncharacterized protein n=1 Tax=Odinarchaeota yellowstonii (strain LCB_4) TaxID=1841599 RepID=A0AAF0D2P9_ODILC|nr:MAG: hypothetical protein OdinLCB4_000990 [Candidatus Odinarchaeum yellowstonii]
MRALKENYKFLTINLIAALGFSIIYGLFDYSNLIVEVVSLGFFIIFLIFSAYFKQDFRVTVLTALILLVSAALILAVGLEVLANQEAIIAYYYLVVGVIGLFIDYIRNRGTNG